MREREREIGKEGSRKKEKGGVEGEYISVFYLKCWWLC